MENIEKPVPLWEKYALTIKEASEYFNIGEKKMRSKEQAVKNRRTAKGRRKIYVYIQRQRGQDSICIQLEAGTYRQGSGREKGQDIPAGKRKRNTEKFIAGDCIQWQKYDSG